MRKVVSPLVLGAILLTSCLPLHAQPAQAPTDRGGQKSGGKVADPGRLLSVEDLNPSYSLSEAGKAYAIRYTSTDGITGTGIVTVSGALFMPKGAPPAGGWPVVAWTHGTVGIGDNCAPSRNPRSERDSAYLNKWLQAGYAIVATDYQGLGTPGPHPYMNSRAAAHSTLDSIRAVVNGRLNLANKALLVGQSQGAAAAFATAGLASEYAPDLGFAVRSRRAFPTSSLPMKMTRERSPLMTLPKGTRSIPRSPTFYISRKMLGKSTRGWIRQRFSLSRLFP